MSGTSKITNLKYPLFFVLSVLGTSLATSSPQDTFLISLSNGDTLKANLKVDPTLSRTAEKGALEGCINQSLSNGVWRVKATQLEKIYATNDAPNFPAWSITLEVKNETQIATRLADAGFSDIAKGIQVTFADGTTLGAEPLGSEDFLFMALPKSGILSYKINFLYPFPVPKNMNTNEKPHHLLLELGFNKISAHLKSKGVVFNRKNPSFKINLDCAK